MRDNHPHEIDAKVTNLLADCFQPESRRSFLAKVTRVVFGLAGVSMASRIPLVGAPAYQSSGWDLCGMAGVKCDTGNCSSTGTSKGSNWKACCQNGNCWKCCTYTDYCSNAVPPNAIGCTSHLGQVNGTRCDGGATVWCGNAGSNYWCTKVSCSSTTHTTQSGCASNCS